MWAIAIAVTFALITGALGFGFALATAHRLRDMRRELDALIEHVDAAVRRLDRRVDARYQV